MAKPGRKPQAATPTNGEPETVSGYFRRILKENPSLLKGHSNEELMARWEQDHPGSKEHPGRIRAILSNVKSVVRSKGRQRGRKAAQAAAAGGDQGRTTPAAARPGRPDLETLEVAIDDCLTMAKVLDRAGLDSVISHLRMARNQVVWKSGQ